MSQKYCKSCGEKIPDGQGDLCSMCYGDIGHGTDGYYEDWARNAQHSEPEPEQE